MKAKAKAKRPSPKRLRIILQGPQGSGKTVVRGILENKRGVLRKGYGIRFEIIEVLT